MTRDEEPDESLVRSITPLAVIGSVRCLTTTTRGSGVRPTGTVGAATFGGAATTREETRHVAGLERAAVAAWAASVPEQIAREGFAQIDIDHLLEQPPALAVAAALHCLSEALAAVRTTVPAVEGLVAVPLPWSDHLDTECPTLADVLAEPWTRGPGREVPGLYVQTSTGWLDADEAGEYRRRLLPDDCLPAGYVAVYRCWQPDPAHREYERVLYLVMGARPGLEEHVALDVWPAPMRPDRPRGRPERRHVPGPDS